MSGPTSIPGPTKLYMALASATTPGVGVAVGVGFDGTMGGRGLVFSGERDFAGEADEDEEDFGEGEWALFSGVEGSGLRDISGDFERA